MYTDLAADLDLQVLYSLKLYHTSEYLRYTHVYKVYLLTH